MAVAADAAGAAGAAGAFPAGAAGAGDEGADGAQAAISKVTTMVVANTTWIRLKNRALIVPPYGSAKTLREIFRHVPRCEMVYLRKGLSAHPMRESAHIWIGK